MKPNALDREFGMSQTIYGLLLRAYPPRHRAQYGAAMAQLFRDQCRDAWNESQTWGLCKLWLRILPDLACTSILERLAALRERKTMTEKLASLSAFRSTPAVIFAAVFVVVFLVVFTIGVAITFILPESYASTARIKVEMTQENSVGGASVNRVFSDPYFIQTTLEIMQSQLVLSNVIARLDLNTQWGRKYFNGETLKTTETMGILKQRMQLATVKNTKLITITVYSDDKNEAAVIANEIAASYRDYRANSEIYLRTQGLAVLLRECQTQEAQIHAAQSEVESLRQQLNIAKDATASQSAQEQPYWDKQRDLSQLRELHTLLCAKLEAKKLDAEMPQNNLVQLVDPAEPGRAPVKPNKTLNIVLGAVAGGFLGLIGGGFALLIAAQVGKRMTATPIAGGSGASGTSGMALHLNASPKASGFGVLFYGIGLALFLLGIALDFLTSVQPGTLLIGLSAAVLLTTALRMGHVKRW